MADVLRVVACSTNLWQEEGYPIDESTQPKGLPKTRRGQKKRQLFLDAARKVFATKGYLEARIVDIASEAGASVGNIYQYFADKDEILKVLLEIFVKDLYESSRPGPKRPDPYQSIEAATRGLFEVYARNPDMFKVMMQVATIDPKYAVLWLDLRRPFVRRVQRMLARLPEFQRTDLNPALAASALGGMATNFAYIWLVMGGDFPDPKPFDLDESVRTVSYLWYRSIYGSDPPAPSPPRVCEPEISESPQG